MTKRRNTKPRKANSTPRRSQRASRPLPSGKKVQSSRTTNSTELSLKQVPRMPQAAPGLPWAMCRLAPWGAAHSSLLPDGSGDPRVVMDLYAYTDLSFGTDPWSGSILTLPSLPFAAALVATAKAPVAVTGSNLQTSTPSTTQGGMYTFNGTLDAGVYLPINATKAASSSTYSDDPIIDNPKNYIKADKARITSMGWRLTYTGVAAQCTGILTVGSAPMRTDPTLDKQTGLVSAIYPDSGPAVTYTATNTPIKIVPTQFTESPTGKDTVSARPETTLHGICRHSSPIYDWTEVYDQPLLLTKSVDGSNQLGGNIRALLAANNPPIVNGGTALNATLSMLDDGWDQTIITLNGVTGTFRFETWQCVEYIPVPESAFYDVARKDTTVDLVGVSKANVAAAAQPVAAGTPPAKA